MASFCVSSVAALQHTHYAGWPEPAETGLRQTRRLGNNTVTVLQADSRLLNGRQNGRGVFWSDAAQSRDVRLSLRTSRRLCTSGPGGSHENWADMVTAGHCVLLFMVVTIQNGLWRAFPPGGSLLEGPSLLQKVDFFFLCCQGERRRRVVVVFCCGGGERKEGRKEEGKESKIVCSSCRNTEGEEWLICMFPLLYVCMCVLSFIVCDILYCSDSWATASYTGLISKASDRNPRIIVVFLWVTLSFEIRLLGCKCV